MRYVIIGNSAAGIFAAEEIRKIDRTGRVDILSQESYPAYARCLTSYYLSGQIKEDKMFIRPENFYDSNNFRLHCSEKAVQVDSAAHKVVTESGKEFLYDRLLIASGASPQMPEIPGMDAKGVFGLRTLQDARNIRAYALSGKRAVVVGGGFVALKAAYALFKAGMEVTCVVSSGQVLSQMLDSDAASLVSSVLTAHGMAVNFRTDVTEILKKGDLVSGVKLKNGEELKADLVVIGKGVVPNTGFLRYSGIALDRGILVDRHLETNIPGVYAAGDVAQGYDAISGEQKINAIWPNATEQGAVAGRNMAGKRVPYSGSIAMNSADFYGLSVIAAGLAKAEGEEYEAVKFFSGKGIYRRLVFRGEQLAGYILVGETSKAGVLTELIREQTNLGSVKQELTAGRFRQKVLW